MRLLPRALAALALLIPAATSPAGSQQPEPQPMLALSDADGQQLVLERLDVRTAVHGMLALTQMEIRFTNPHGRVMEGRFSAVLPEDATISRFAKEVGGALMEGEVVERLKANQVYDQILQQMRDPALLEQDQGNRFSARIFPIGPNDTVRLVLGYSQTLPMRGGERAYVLPLRGLPKVGLFTFRGTLAALPGERPGPYLLAASREGAAGTRVIERSDEAFTPTEDLALRWRAEPSAAAVRVMAAGEFYAVSFRPDVAPRPAAAGPGHWVFYLDTSASSAEGAEHRVRALERLLAALPAADRVELRAFDHRVVPLGSGSAAAMARRVGPLLRERLFLGGTDLDAMTRDLAARAAALPRARFVAVTDGVATLGKAEGADLLRAAERIPAAATVHALVLGARQDAPTLRLLTRGRGRIVAVPFSETLDAAAAEAARRLALPAGASFTVSDPGAEWLLSGTLDDVQPGDEVVAFARLRPGMVPYPRLAGSDGSVLGVPAALPAGAGSLAPLLRREAHRAWLAELAERERAAPDDSTRRALAAEQVRISVEERVMIPRTTLLVLESEADYRRFGLDRRALADILTVGPGGVAVLQRDPARLATVAADGTAGEDDVSPPLPGPDPARAEALIVTGAEGGEAAAGEEGEEGEAAAEVNIPPPPVEPPPPPSMEPPPPVEAPPPVPTGTQELVPPAEPVAAPEASERRREAAAARAPERERKVEAPAWTRPEPVTRAHADSLAALVRAEPRRRDLYNRLSEAQWALSDWQALRRTALAWQPLDPENPQVYEALGEAALRLGRQEEARRAFASLVEVAPARPELLQRAGLLLLRAGAAELAVAPLRRSLAQRPDRVNGYRHLALVLWQTGREAEAAEVLEEATRQRFPEWYRDVQRVVREELGYVYRAWAAKEPARRREIEGQAAEMGIDLGRADALRITLAWETDGNDVDLHVVDPAGEEAYYGSRTTALGLELYEDITRGFGPEVVRAGRVVPGTYHVGVNYFSAGPMGVSRGIVVVMQPDSRGVVRQVQVHPFRLIEGGNDMRLLARVTIPAGR